MIIILGIIIFLVIPVLILIGISWITKDYSEEEKQQVWENFYKGFNNFKK